jgi:hypothetical protein
MEVRTDHPGWLAGGPSVQRIASIDLIVVVGAARQNKQTEPYAMTHRDGDFRRSNSIQY